MHAWFTFEEMLWGPTDKNDPNYDRFRKGQKTALAPVRYEEAFMPAVSPAQLAGWNKNEYYRPLWLNRGKRNNWDTYRPRP